MRRVFSVMIAIVVVLTLASQAVAATPEAASCQQTGDGSKKAPYVICNYADFQLVHLNPSAHFVLGQDIDFGFLDWNPITNFSGVFDGNNYKLMTFRGVGNGLFETIGEGGVVKNLYVGSATATGDYNVGIIAGANYGTIENVQVQGSSVTGKTNVGIIAGSNTGKIRNSHTLFYVWVTAGANGGGIAGMNAKDGVIEKSSTDRASVTGDSVTGGIVGLNYGKVKKTSAQGVLYSDTEWAAYAGGIVGKNMEGAEVRNSKADVNLYTRTNEFVGLVYGRNQGIVKNSAGYGQLLPY